MQAHVAAVVAPHGAEEGRSRLSMDAASAALCLLASLPVTAHEPTLQQLQHLLCATLCPETMMEDCQSTPVFCMLLEES